MKQPKCTIEPNGTKKWYLNGELHREDGPAVEWSDGTKSWYLNGERHREDGPAVERPDGTKLWYINGKLHREDGPAEDRPVGTKSWHLNGKLHREDGPAVERPDGTNLWCINGKEITTSPINIHGLKVGDLVFIESEPAIVTKKTETFIHFFLDKQEVVYVNG